MPKIKIKFHGWMAPRLQVNSKPYLELEISSDATVRQVLAELAKRDPTIDQCVVSAKTGQYQDQAMLILNGRLLELAGGLDTTFDAGDVLEVMPPCSGG